MRADPAELGDTVHFQPVEKGAHGYAVSGARVRVAEVGSEEIDEAQPGRSPAAAIIAGTGKPVAGSMMVIAVLFPGRWSGYSVSFMAGLPIFICDLDVAPVHSRGVTRRRPVRYQPSKASITRLKNRGGRKP
jgi:hypothetical protein